jgi:hypothetical protein
MQLTDMIDTPLWAIILLSIAGGLGMLMGLALLASLIFATLFSEGPPAPEPALRYDVIPVNPEHEHAFRQMNPLLPDWGKFAETVLSNPDYVAHHSAIRTAARRFAAQHAGMRLFVKVTHMPS